MGNQKHRFDRLQAEIQGAQHTASLDLVARRQALGELEKLGSSKVVSYYSPRQALVREDITPFAQMLLSAGVVMNLDVIIVSPGGDGTAAETIVDLCRKYCSDRLRVVIPTSAKSAATLIALAADEIVMGESSELGPIDAQVNVSQDGCQHQVSADHVLRARDEAIQMLANPDPNVVQAGQIQLSTLSAPFVQYCEDAMNFARDFAGKQLRSHMFKLEFPTNNNLWGNKIDSVVANLTSSSRHLTHGRMITAQDIADDDDLSCLKITNLASDAPYWSKLLELQLRTDIIAQQNDFQKVLFASDFQLFAG